MELYVKLCFILGIIIAIPLYAQQIHTAAEYNDLLKKYECIENKNFAAWYNIGILQEKLGNQGKALSAFLHAQKQAGFSEFYQAAKPMQVICSCVHLDPFMIYGGKIYAYIYSIPLYVYQYILLLLLFLCIGLWYGVIRYCKNRKYAYIFLFLCAGWYSLYSMKYTWLNTSYAVILENKAVCYAGPDTSFLVIDTMQSPATYIIYKEENGFYQIKNHGKVCWIMKKDVEKV